MKYFVFVFTFVLFSAQIAYTGSVNQSVYRTMSAQSYRANHRANVQPGIMPYWQAQSSYTTRNRVYQNYSNYDNQLQRYNNMRQSQRGYGR